MCTNCFEKRQSRRDSVVTNAGKDVSDMWEKAEQNRGCAYMHGCVIEG